MRQDSDLKKSQLVSEICNISTRSIACRHGCSSPVQSSFIDWYRILQVKENAGADVIRRRYHELALQLHPDKNKHPKAEIAFKLVSEAYSCISDSAKRRVFDLERWGKFCIECGTIPYTTSHHTSSNANASSGHKAWDPTSRSKSNKVVKGLKDIRNRFREEARVIKNCLRVNAAPRKESSLFSPPVYDVLQRNPTRESPVFNPSDHMVQGYPHLRSRVYDKPAPPQNFSNFWHLRTGHRIVNYEQGRRTFDSPVFEVRSDRGIWKSRSTCVRS